MDGKNASRGQLWYESALIALTLAFIVASVFNSATEDDRELSAVLLINIAAWSTLLVYWIRRAHWGDKNAEHRNVE